MEPKKIKKLVLNQEVISTLSEDKMNNIKGAGTDPIKTCPSGLTTMKCCPVNTPNCTVGCPSDGCHSQVNGSQCGTCVGGTGYAMCCDTAGDTGNPGQSHLCDSLITGFQYACPC